MFEIVVDKKLVPKEVLETGGKKTENLSIMTSHIALCFYFVHMMGISPRHLTLNQANWSRLSCLPGILWVLWLPSALLHHLSD